MLSCVPWIYLDALKTSFGHGVKKRKLIWKSIKTGRNSII